MLLTAKSMSDYFQKTHKNSSKHGQDNLISSDFSMTPCFAQHCVQEGPEKDHITTFTYGYMDFQKLNHQS